ncbi:SDR family NAD(P)-dependent oxidoreductase [Conexibacter arvalis]|nr:SDR family NAD(P)-dependent oxidoreductase [Conexibacter arvalis]
MRFEGKVALVTGGASGIGAETAAKLASEGARVVIADLDGEGAERIAAELRSGGAEAVGVACDQTDEAQVAALFSETVGRFDRLDVCHANAGWCRVGPVLDVSARTWRRHFDVNVTGTFLVCQAAARRMAQCGNGGSIVMTSSSGAVQPAAFFSAYCSAKAALNMLTAVMAYELGVHRVRVNAVMPGVTETAMTADLLATGARELFEREVPLARLGRPADIADAVAFLASDDSAYMTGQSLLVDGGGGIGASWFVTDFRARGSADWRLRHEALAAAAEAA